MAVVKDWTFEGTWPYVPHWFDSDDGRMHYIDEGPRYGRPMVMVSIPPRSSSQLLQSELLSCDFFKAMP